MHVTVRFPAALLAAWVLWHAVVFAADPSGAMVTPPLAQGQTVSVLAGREIDIPLVVSGRAVEPVSFYVRTPPRLGKLDDVRVTGRTTATVTYRAPATTGEDVFTFAAKSFDSPVSAPARVKIRIIQPTATLVVQSEVDFGAVYAGQPAMREITIRNTGAGPAMLSPQVSAPWEVATPGARRLAGGESLVLPVVFSPATTGDFSATLLVSPGTSVSLKGRGLAPFAFSPALVELDADDGGRGSALVRVQNLSETERTLAFSWPECVEGPDTVTLTPNAETALTVTRRHNVGAYEGSANVVSGAFRDHLPIRIFQAGPRIAIAPTALDFGQVPAGTSPVRELKVTNAGQSAAPVRVAVPPECDAEPQSASVAPGAGVTIVVTLREARPGRMDERVFVTWGEASRIEVPVRADVSDWKKPAVGLPAPPPSVASHSDAPTVSIQRRPVAMPDVLELEPTSAVVQWQTEADRGGVFRVEQRRLVINDSGAAEAQWLPLPEMPVTNSGGLVSARVRHLPPGTVTTVRLIAIGADGKPSSVSPPVRIATPRLPGPPLWVVGCTLLAILIAVGAGSLIRASIRRRREELQRRIQQLEPPDRRN